MSIRTSLYISCDFGCKNVYGYDPIFNWTSYDEIRTAAKLENWTSQRGHDYCPIHSKTLKIDTGK